MQRLCSSKHMIAWFNSRVGLKPKGKWLNYDNVQVVLLLKRILIYQGYDNRLVDLKNGNRDITESSLVFFRSKDERASGEPLLSHTHKL